MAARTSSSKKPKSKSATTRRVKAPKVETVRFWKQPLRSIHTKTSTYLSRRPHRSFRRTRRRDYKRSLALPGYWAFTNYVRKTVWDHRKLFILLTIVYAILTAVMVGVGSQDSYSTLTDTLKTTGNGIFAGNWGAIGQASLLFLATITGGISATPTEAQQIYAGLLVLLAWLTSVWLLRNILAGHKVKLRDGLYNAGAPILSTFLVALVLIVQLLPLALAIIGYSAASTSGLLNGGVEAMLFWIAAGLLATLSLYWMTSTLIALVVVTLPGMYPFKALRIAGDLVIGRRLRILLRILWMALGIAVTWVVVMLPIILFDTWIKSLWSAISWVPTVPVALLILSSLTLIWVASYIYLLYRKVVADDAEPA